MCACMYVHMYVCMHVCMYMYVCMYVCMYVSGSMPADSLKASSVIDINVCFIVHSAKLRTYPWLTVVCM